MREVHSPAHPYDDDWLSLSRKPQEGFGSP
jgi:hypothetical protein